MKIAKCFRIIATIMLIIVIALSVPFVVPKLLGFQICKVVTSSMEPEMQVGSIVYIQKCDADEIKVGDIISFYLGTDEENIISHRVVSISEEGLYSTKGDANDYIDDFSVNYNHVLGKVIFKINKLSFLSDVFNSATGLILIIGIIIISFVLNIASDIIMKEKLKVNKNHLLIVVALIMIVVSAVNIIYILRDYNNSEELYKKINQDYTNKISDENQWYNYISVDFDSLKNINDDIVGWIYFENNDISYPIMYSGNDDEYLRKSFDNKESTAGSIFLEGLNNPDFTDKNLIIYGHNMRNLSMFGLLKMYTRDVEYYENNRYFQLVTPKATYRYEIFAYETINEDSDVYQISFSSDDDFMGYLDMIKSLSERKINTKVDSEDNIITLSTCSTISSHKRFVVHAVRVDEHLY